MITRLLSSTAILGSILFASGEASATAPSMAVPTLTISGQSSFNAWWFHNERQEVLVGTSSEGVPGPGQIGFTPDSAKSTSFGKGYLFTQDDSRLKFDVSGKTDPGMDYGLTIVVNGDTNKTKSIKENYVWFGGSWGKLTLGDAEGVERTMAFGGFDPLGGTGGFDGNFDRVVNFTSGTLHSVNLVGDTSRSTKATYQTPRWKGLQAGVSYTPRTEHRGEAFQNSKNSYNSPKEVWATHSIAAALNFIHKFNNGFEMAFSGTAVFDQVHTHVGSNNPVTIFVYDQKLKGVQESNVLQGPVGGEARSRFNPSLEDGRSFALGYLFDYKGWSWGGEFGHNGKSHQMKVAGANNAWFLDTGLSYTWGATKVSTGYYYGQAKSMKINPSIGEGKRNFTRTKARTHIITVAVDHKLAPGVGMYCEYAHYDMKNKGSNVDAAIQSTLADPATVSPSYTLGTASNKANAVVVGTKIKF